MSAAAKAAADQKEFCWIRVGKVKAKPKLTDPLQLFSKAEVTKTDGVGEDAICTCKVVQVYYDEPFDSSFILPQGGGLDVGEEIEVPRKELLIANSEAQDMTVRCPLLSVQV
eukprot:SAG11_NODE_8330_length_1027_cov_2.668103_2_plen_112_part_00